MKGCIALLALFFIAIIGHAQSSSTKQASLTVTVTIDSSVELVMDSDGREAVTVTNAPDPIQTFAPRPPLRNNQFAKSASALKAHAPRSGKLVSSEADAVEYRFPGAAAAFEIRKEIVWIDLQIAGRKQREAVVLTTVVAR